MPILIQKMKPKLSFSSIKNLPPQIITSIIYLVCSVLQKGISFFAVPLYTRLVPSCEYGIYSLYQSWDSILIIFATLNMWNYLFNNGMIKYAEKKDEFTSALIGLNLTLTTCLFLLFFVAHDWFSSISGLPLAVMALMFLDFYTRPAYEYWCSRQRFEYNVKKYAITATMIALFTPLLSITFVYLLKTYSFFESGVGLVAGKVVCSGMFFTFITFSLIKKCHVLYNKSIWKYALKYNLPLVPHFLSTIVLSQSDRIMIGNLCGISEAGIYSVAYSVAAVMLIFNSAIMDSIIPWTYRCLSKKDYTKFPAISQLSLIVIAIFNVIVAITAPEIISFMAPNEYRAAVYIIPPVAISNVFIFMYNLYANIEYFYEKTKLIAIASLFSAIINVVLNIVFIKAYGFVAAGYTTLGCYIVYAYCHFLLMKKVMKEQSISYIYNNIKLWLIAVVASVISVSCISLYDEVRVRYLLLSVGVLLIVITRKKIYRKLIMIRRLKENE